MKREETGSGWKGKAGKQAGFREAKWGQLEKANPTKALYCNQCSAPAENVHSELVQAQDMCSVFTQVLFSSYVCSYGVHWP